MCKLFRILIRIYSFVLIEVSKLKSVFVFRGYAFHTKFFFLVLGLFNLSKIRISFFSNYRYGSLFTLFVLADESVSYSLFSIFRDVYFFIYVCSSNLFFSYFIYYLYFFFVFFLVFLKFLVFERFSCILFFSLFFSLFILFDFFVVFLFFFILNFFLFFLEKLFKQRLASLFLFSKDFLCLEDEDLWVSSTILYFDDKLIEFENVYVRLKTHEIDVFHTLLHLFFDVHKTNVQYAKYTIDFDLLEMHKIERRKYFRKISSSFTDQLADLRSKQNSAALINMDKTRLEFRFFNFYKLFHKLNFMYVESKHLRKKKFLLRNKQIKNRNFKFSHLKSQQKFVTSNISDIFSDFSQKQNLSNESVRLKSFLRFYTSPQRDESLFFVPAHKNFRTNSRFLRFFWFSFPVYLFRVNYFVSWVVLLFSRRYFPILSERFIDKLYSAIYSWVDPSLEPSDYVRQTFLNSKDFSLYWKKGYQYFSSFDQFLSFVSFAIENEISDINKDVPVSESEDLDSSALEKSEQKEDLLLFQKSAYEQRSKRTVKSKFNKATKIRKSRRKNRLIRRKPLTSRYIWMNTRRKYLFLNSYSFQLYKKYPDLKLIDLYKLLEYFYFVLVNDSDFYQNVDFAAKVALLKDKYGSAIVNDLLSKDDHRQARAVSMQLHVSSDDNLTIPQFESGGSSNSSEFSSLEPDIGASVSDVSDIKSKFKLGSHEITPNVSLFAKNLIHSYRNRFRD